VGNSKGTAQSTNRREDKENGMGKERWMPEWKMRVQKVENRKQRTK
jgi:hypothetical protein